MGAISWEIHSAASPFFTFEPSVNKLIDVYITKKSNGDDKNPIKFHWNDEDRSLSPTGPIRPKFPLL